MSHLMKLQTAPRAALRRAKSRMAAVPLVPEDEAWLAAQYNHARGYDRPLEVQAEEARKALADAPVTVWHPSAPRHLV